MKESKEAVFFGELLMRLATKRYERFVQAREFEVGYTGAEANAAVSLAHFGLGAYLVSVVPDTEIGDACINFVRQFGATSISSCAAASVWERSTSKRAPRNVPRK
jgi:2-dehydro-3-deoxygluconokinase